MSSLKRERLLLEPKVDSKTNISVSYFDDNKPTNEWTICLLIVSSSMSVNISQIKEGS